MSYILLFFIYSFIGWSIEVIRTLYYDKKFVNRGFLIGPICPVYGYGCLLITFLLDKYLKDPLVLLIMAIVVFALLEYLTSYFMEKIFKVRWWDYSRYKYNINGRICLETMIPFGIGGFLVMYVTNPLFLKLIALIPPLVLNIIVGIILIIYVIDNFISLKIINNVKNLSLSINSDSTETISNYVRSQLKQKSFLHKRLNNAFPNIIPNIERIKKQIDKKIQKQRKKLAKYPKINNKIYPKKIFNKKKMKQ